MSIGLLLLPAAHGQDEARALEAAAPAEVRVSALVDGLVFATQVKVGDRVEEGQVLLQIDSRELELLLHIAQAGVDVAKAGIMVQKAELDTARARLAAVKDSDSSPAEVASAESAVKIAEGYLHKAEASAAAAEMEAELRKLHLSWSRVTAPVSGTVIGMTARMGEFVSRKQKVVVIATDES